MFLTVHAATATLIGMKIGNPIIAFLAGLLSHFIFDMIPHGDEKLGKKFFGYRIKTLQEQGELKFLALYGTIDSFFLALFLIFLFKNFDFANSDAVVMAIIGGIIPDILVACYKLTDSKWLRWFYKLHQKNHEFISNKIKRDFPLKYGIAMQIIFFVIIVWLTNVA